MYDIHSWLQWHWARWCIKSSRGRVLGAGWCSVTAKMSPQVSWERGSAHSSWTYHNEHLCSLLPASISLYFLINTYLKNETVLFLVLEHRRSTWSRSGQAANPNLVSIQNSLVFRWWRGKWLLMITLMYHTHLFLYLSFTQWASLFI